jgi:hypothetical protein
MWKFSIVDLPQHDFTGGIDDVLRWAKRCIPSAFPPIGVGVDVAALEADGRAEVFEDPYRFTIENIDRKSVEPMPVEVEEVDITDLNADEAIDRIEAIAQLGTLDESDELRRMLAIETEGKKRKTVIAALKEALGEA